MRQSRDSGGVTLANWQDPPFNRWAFLHLGELLRMAPIARGTGPVKKLGRDQREHKDAVVELAGEGLAGRRHAGEDVHRRLPGTGMMGRW